MRYVAPFIGLIVAVITIGCGGGDEQATPTTTPTVAETVEARETPTPTEVVTETPVTTPEPTPYPTPTEEPATPVPTLEENNQKLASALEMEPDGIGRYETPDGAFRVIYIPEAGEEGVDFIIYINEHPVRENADRAVAFIHSVGISDHCNPILRIAWVGPETGPLFTKEDFPICVR